MMKFVILAALAVASYGASIPEYQDSGIEEYIVGGKDTDISEVPYQVAMYKNGRFMCGGSTVSPTMIVTAAHCVVGQIASQITFRAGSSEPNGGGVVVQAKRLMPHMYYNSNTMDYDVAVVELQQPLTFSNTIRPIGLAASEPYNGAQVKASGFGILRKNGPLATTLQSVTVPMVNRRTCATYLAQYARITPRMICAGVEGKDSCQGDSGGPLNSGAHSTVLANLLESCLSVYTAPGETCREFTLVLPIPKSMPSSERSPTSNFLHPFIPFLVFINRI